jgi:hypothetical protein
MPLIVAKREGPCDVCKLMIAVGERIHYTRLTKARHLACADDRDDPEEHVRASYSVWRELLDDEQSFDACVEEFGYVAAVKALYRVSPTAKQREDSYQARVKASREHRAARRSGYTYR